MHTVTVALSYPLPNRAEVRLRRPLRGDFLALKGARGGGLRRSLLMFQRLSGVPLSELEQLDAADLERINQAFASFAPAEGR